MLSAGAAADVPRFLAGASPVTAELGVQLVFHTMQEPLPLLLPFPLVKTLHQRIFVVHGSLPYLSYGTAAGCVRAVSFLTRSGGPESDRLLCRYPGIIGHDMPVLLHMIDRVIAWLDQFQQRHHAAAFGYGVLRKYLDDQAGHTAAMLAYYGFLSLFPLLLVATTLLRLALHSSAGLRGQIIDGALAYFPLVGRDLQQNIHDLSGTGLVLAVGVLLTLYGARSVADVLRHGLDHIWQVPYARRSRFPGSLLRSLVIITLGGLGLALVPVVSGYALAFGQSGFFVLLSMAVTLVALFWVLVFIIKIGLSTRRRLNDIWPGALLAAIGLEVLQSLGTYIVGRELNRLDTLYGTFAIVLGLLYWLYLQAQVLLIALEVDPVRVFRLWPRSLRQPLTDADHRAYTLYHERGRFHELSGS